MINIIATLSLITSLFVLFFGLFVFFKNKNSKVNTAFLIFTLSPSLWLFSNFMAYNSKSESNILTWFNISYTGVILIPSTWYLFTFLFLGRKKDKLVIFNFVVSFIFIFLVHFSRHFILGLHKYSWGYYPKVSPTLHPIFLFFFGVAFTIIVLSLFFGFWRKSSNYSPIQQIRIKYIFIGSVITSFSGIDFIPNYGIGIYPFGFIFMLPFPILFTYAILRHQLMEIEVIIKKSLVFAGVFAFIFGVVVVIAILIAQLLGGTNNLLALAISSFIIVLTLRPIETWLINSTDKFLFQKKYEYKQIIETFLGEVITKSNLDEVVNSTLKILDQTLHPYTAAIFILNKAEDKYQLYNAYGLENKNIVFTSESKLVSFLKKSHNPAVIKQVDGISGVNPEIQAEMAGLKAVICLPFIQHSDLIGFISLGRKKSEEEYTKENLDVLLTLAHAEPVAIANSLLLADVAQSERRAAIGTMAAGINHEIGNPLNIINTKIQVFCNAVERGFYKDKPKEEIMAECVAILKETIKQTERIAEITKKLSSFAKPGKEFRPVVVSVPQEIDNALGIVGHDLELERIKIVKEISPQPNEILADKGETQQIFFNIIRNAGQAIEGPGTITIRAFTTPDGKVRIEIEDTGKGIPDDKAHRVFEPFFTTKGPNKGTGLGLSIVRQLVWKNKGEISFKSQVGAGTTFILEFPKAE